MEESEIHVGDVLKIRSWEDMEAEYGINGYGDIMPAGGAHFNKEMCHLCGRTFTVSEIVTRGKDYPKYYSEEGIERRVFGRWTILSWMLEPCKDDDDVLMTPSDDEIALLFS